MLGAQRGGAPISRSKMHRTACDSSSRISLIKKTLNGRAPGRARGGEIKEAAGPAAYILRYQSRLASPPISKSGENRPPCAMILYQSFGRRGTASDRRASCRHCPRRTLSEHATCSPSSPTPSRQSKSFVCTAVARPIRPSSSGRRISDRARKPETAARSHRPPPPWRS